MKSKNAVCFPHQLLLIKKKIKLAPHLKDGEWMEAMKSNCQRTESSSLTRLTSSGVRDKIMIIDAIQDRCKIFDNKKILRGTRRHNVAFLIVNHPEIGPWHFTSTNVRFQLYQDRSLHGDGVRHTCSVQGRRQEVLENDVSSSCLPPAWWHQIWPHHSPRCGHILLEDLVQNP